MYSDVAVLPVPTGEEQTTGHGEGAVAPLPGRTHQPRRPPLGQGAWANFVWQLWRDDGDTRLVGRHGRGAQQQGPPVEAVLRNAPGRLSLTPPPASAPARHPEERLWQWMRRVVTPNHGFATMPEQRQAIRDGCCDLAGRKQEVRQLWTIKTPESLLALL